MCVLVFCLLKINVMFDGVTIDSVLLPQWCLGYLDTFTIKRHATLECIGLRLYL